MAKYLHVATITDKHGNVLAEATNSYEKTHPIQAKFGAQFGKPDAIYLHAEIAALVRLKPTDKPHKIFVARYRKNGTTGLSKPCAVCDAAIKHWGIKFVEYTT